MPTEDDLTATAAMASTLRRSLMVRWKARAIRAAIVLGALASLAIASGAGARWQ